MSAGTDATQPAEHFLFERYVRKGGDEKESLPLRAYYALKPLIPRRAQLAMRRRYAKRQAQRPFPRWPVEPLLVDRLEEELRARIAAQDGRPLPLVAPWPAGHRFAFVLTHDVEGTKGIGNIEAVRAVERKHGFVSSWIRPVSG